MENCEFAKITGQEWFFGQKNGPKTIRCFRPNALALPVAGGTARYATVGDTFDPKAPAKPQILFDSAYISVRSCQCNPSKCAFYKAPSL